MFPLLSAPLPDGDEAAILSLDDVGYHPRVTGGIALLAILMIAFPGGPVLAAPDASQPTGAETTKTPEPLFRVTLLGTGNPRPSIDRFGPAILVEAGDTKLLFDCGRGATQRLFQLDGDRK